jgi:hypothetical protein
LGFGASSASASSGASASVIDVARRLVFGRLVFGEVARRTAPAFVEAHRDEAGHVIAHADDALRSRPPDRPGVRPCRHGHGDGRARG